MIELNQNGVINCVLIGIVIGIALVAVFDIVKTILHGTKPHLSERERNKLIGVPESFRQMLH